MKKYIAIVGCALILMVVFALLIYPTPYKYIEYTHESGRTLPVRVNILTGTTEVFTIDFGWKVVKNSDN